jgi:hypothetical protein
MFEVKVKQLRPPREVYVDRTRWEVVWQLE